MVDDVKVNLDAEERIVDSMRTEGEHEPREGQRQDLTVQRPVPGLQPLSRDRLPQPRNRLPQPRNRLPQPRDCLPQPQDRLWQPLGAVRGVP